MDMEILYFSLILLITYAELRVFTWDQMLKATKPAFLAKDLIQTGNKKCKIVKSAYWTRDLIGTDLKS